MYSTGRIMTLPIWAVATLAWALVSVAFFSLAAVKNQNKT